MTEIIYNATCAVCGATVTSPATWEFHGHHSVHIGDCGCGVLEHRTEDDGGCWCQPYLDPLESRVIIHRRVSH